MVYALLSRIFHGCNLVFSPRIYLDIGYIMRVLSVRPRFSSAIAPTLTVLLYGAASPARLSALRPSTNRVPCSWANPALKILSKSIIQIPAYGTPLVHHLSRFICFYQRGYDVVGLRR